MCDEEYRIEELKPAIEKALRGSFHNAMCELNTIINNVILRECVKNDNLKLIKIEWEDIQPYIEVWEGRWIRYFKADVFDLIDSYVSQVLTDTAHAIIAERIK